MILFKRSETNMTYTYKQNSYLFFSILVLVSLILFFVSPTTFPFGQNLSYWSVGDYWFTILIVFLILDIGGMYVTYAKAQSSGKKISNPAIFCQVIKGMR